MIVFKDVSFAYSARQRVVCNLSVTINKGEKVCLLGLNGSGKSTLLKLAAGLLMPGNGHVLIDGDATDDQRAALKVRSQVGFIFQNPQDQIVATTIESDIAFTLENLAFPPDVMKKRVEEMAQRFGLIDLLKRHPEAISAGEEQRTALAGTLAPSPSILLLDEPTSFLDYAGKERLREILFTDATTILAATQFPSEALQFERVLLLDQGQLVFDGSADALFTSQTWQQLKTDSDAIQTTKKKQYSASAIGDRKESNVIEAENVSFSYQAGTDAVREIDLAVSTGEIIAIVGSSGSGKSSLGLLLSGLLTPTAGIIRYPSNQEGDRLVGYLMQFPERQFFADNVHDEVAFGIESEQLPVNESKARVADSLALVGLNYDSFAVRSPFTLSGGEQRRLALASLLVMNRPILILDEPTASLDWQGTQQLLELLHHLRRSGKTILILSHDLDFVSRVADRLILLDKGRLRWSGAKFATDFPTLLFESQFGGLPQPLQQARQLHREGLSPIEIAKRLLNDQSSESGDLF